MTCKDCIHYGVCRFSYDIEHPLDIFKNGGASNCEDFHPNNCPDCRNYVPCKIGDELWAIRNVSGKLKVLKGKVSEMYYVGKEMKLCIVVKNIARGTWGKDIFPTQEEAEKRLADEKQIP